MAIINGTSGDDSLAGTSGTDTFSGGDGNDQFTLNASDSADGGFGDDTFTSAWGTTDKGTLTLHGGAGEDTFSISLSNTKQGVYAYGADGQDIFNVKGHGNISLNGGAGDDSFWLTDVSSATLTLGSGRDRVELLAQDTTPTVTITSRRPPSAEHNTIQQPVCRGTRLGVRDGRRHRACSTPPRPSPESRRAREECREHGRGNRR